MGLGVWTELCCDECFQAAGGEWADEFLPIGKLKSNAERAGWIVSDDWAFCSDECRQKHEQATS